MSLNAEPLAGPVTPLADPLHCDADPGTPAYRREWLARLGAVADACNIYVRVTQRWLKEICPHVSAGVWSCAWRGKACRWVRYGRGRIHPDNAASCCHTSRPRLQGYLLNGRWSHGLFGEGKAVVSDVR